MTLLSHPRPAVADHDAAALLRTLYGLEGTPSALPSERDRNFRIQSGDGRAFTLRIANAAEDPGAVVFQTDLLAHVGRVDPQAPTPRVIPTSDGANVAGHKTEDGVHAVHLLTYLPGIPLAEAERSAETLRDLGGTLARLDRALAGFGHPGAHRSFDWEMRAAGRSRGRLDAVEDGERRAMVARFLDGFESRALPALGRLRHQVIHNDANDWNVLVGADGRIAGLIDFGDAVHGPLIAELAVACAYALLDHDSPAEAAATLAAGYHEVLPLEAAELDLLFDLIAARLCTSVTIAAWRAGLAKDNPYLLVSVRGAWALLERLEAIGRTHFTAIVRAACGFEAVDGARRTLAWIEGNRRRLAPVLTPHPARQTKHLLDLAAGPLAEASAAGDHAAARAAYDGLRQEHGFDLGIGPWGERRIVYTAPFFDSVLIRGRRRTMHLGLDLFAPDGTAVHAPLDGHVAGVSVNTAPQDYGGLVLLVHEPEPGVRFGTLWGHLDPDSVSGLRPGQRLAAGEAFARLGAEEGNGGWVPHLHLQLVMAPDVDLSAIPGVGEEAFAAVWAGLYPDPATLAGLPPETFRKAGRPAGELLERRRAMLGLNLSLSYRKPLKMVRGEDVWLIDESGRAFLDCYNNVAHVGHCHPRVVEAITRQAAILNTNTRYLHDNIVAYVERLAETLPAPLSRFYLTCSGSEANELALRMARAYTGRRDTVVLDWAYHGHTQGLIDISPYKYKRRGGAGRPDHVHEARLPDTYRPPQGWEAAEVGPRCVAEMRDLVAGMVRDGRPPAAFIAETIPSVAGQVFLPKGYLAGVYEAVRAGGGICIADEVQVGFGRVGDGMWAFEEQGVVPDIVTMGKPIGNGHPMAVVACRPEIAESFANGMEYFNTFGGNPVSCAAGLAVLDVLRDEGLRENAAAMGAYLKDGLWALADRFPAVGDVRGRGLFLGVDLVTDRTTKAPATAQAGAIVNRARELGVLAGTDGPADNVIKLRPPMTFRREHADILLDVLRRAMEDVLG